MISRGASVYRWKSSIRNRASYSTPWVSNVTAPPGNQVYMRVRNGLPCIKSADQRAKELSPLKHYSRNVANILAGKPYRKGKPDKYRRVHHALGAAQRQGHSIKLTFFCNVFDAESINEVERVIMPVLGLVWHFGQCRFRQEW
jgi:hypothetical protein